FRWFSTFINQCDFTSTLIIMHNFRHFFKRFPAFSSPLSSLLCGNAYNVNAHTRARAHSTHTAYIQHTHTEYIQHTHSIHTAHTQHTHSTHTAYIQHTHSTHTAHIHTAHTQHTRSIHTAHTHP